MIADLEARLRYAEFHRDAAAQQRKAAIGELRGLQRQKWIDRGKP